MRNKALKKSSNFLCYYFFFTRLFSYTKLKNIYPNKRTCIIFVQSRRLFVRLICYKSNKKEKEKKKKIECYKTCFVERLLSGRKQIDEGA